MILFSEGANPDIPDSEGKCPLHYAVEFPTFYIPNVEALLNNGCDEVNFVDFIELLLREGILEVDEILQTPFMHQWYEEQKKTPRLVSFFDFTTGQWLPYLPFTHVREHMECFMIVVN